MESSILNTAIEFESRRVAAAFEVKVWEYEGEFSDGSGTVFSGLINSQVLIRIGVCEGRVGFVTLVEQLHGAIFFQCENQLDLEITRLTSAGAQELMARGLYRLGFEDEAVWAQLPALSMHEQLHLRQTLPREYWPQKWLDEAAGACQISI